MNCFLFEGVEHAGYRWGGAVAMQGQKEKVQTCRRRFRDILGGRSSPGGARGKGDGKRLSGGSDKWSLSRKGGGRCNMQP